MPVSKTYCPDCWFKHPFTGESEFTRDEIKIKAFSLEQAIQIARALPLFDKFISPSLLKYNPPADPNERIFSWS
jgi:hypothetical protein